MAKSIRAKTKRAFRRVKRESGVFAVADAARLHRLSTKLRAKLSTDQEGDVTLPAAIEDAVEHAETMGGPEAEVKETAMTTEEGMVLDSPTPKKISTSGRRLSRRESWRLSKGKPIPTKNPNKLNRLGGVSGKRKAGRSKRRR